MSGNGQERRRVAKAFGAELKIARKKCGLSQEALGAEANMDRTYPSLLERGLRTPTLTIVIDLARVLHVDPAQLVSDTLKRMCGGS